MAKPSSVRIGSVVFDVVFCKISGSKYGDTSTFTSRIRIDQRASDSQQRSTLFHEVLHAICGVYGVHRYDVPPRDVEEAYVGFLEVGVLNFVRDNPDVWDWINGFIDELEED